MPWLGQALEDFPIEWRGSCIRTQEQAQACMQAGQAAVERGEGLIRAAEETRELLRPFHRRHKIERARRDAWALVYVRLEVEGWSEALSEARTNLAAARRAHAQHPGRAGRVRALALADVAVAEMVAGEHTAQSTYDSLLALDEEGRPQRILRKAGIVLAGLSAADTTTEVARRACLEARDAELGALRALTRASEEVPGEIPWSRGDDGDTFYVVGKARIKGMRRGLGKQRRVPPPRHHAIATEHILRHWFACRSPRTRVRTSPPPA